MSTDIRAGKRTLSAFIAIRYGAPLIEPGGAIVCISSVVAKRPIGCAGEPEDTAQAVRYLAGSESSWVTGQSFAIDGGSELRKNPDLFGRVTRLYGEAAMAAVRLGKAP